VRLRTFQMALVC